MRQPGLVGRRRVHPWGQTLVSGRLQPKTSFTTFSSRVHLRRLVALPNLPNDAAHGELDKPRVPCLWWHMPHLMI